MNGLLSLTGHDTLHVCKSSTLVLKVRLVITGRITKRRSSDSVMRTRHGTTEKVVGLSSRTPSRGGCEKYSEKSCIANRDSCSERDERS